MSTFKQLVFLAVFALTLTSSAAVYKLPFQGGDFGKWSLGKGTEVVRKGGTSVLRVRANSPAERAIASINLPMEKLGGRTVTFRCEVRAVGVTKPAHPWNGIKFMLGVVDDIGKMKYPAANFPVADRMDFDFKTVDFAWSIPKNSQGTLHLGLQESTGLVEFRNLVVITEELSEIFPPPTALPKNFRCEYSDAVMNMPTYRGAMSSAIYRKGDLDELAKWGANLVRWQIQRSFGKVDVEMDIDDFNRYIDGKLDELDLVFADCRRLGMKVMVDLHAPPGGLIDSRNMRIFFDAKYRTAFYNTWRRIIEHTQKNKDLIYGYDLINEPRQVRKSDADYLKTQYEAAKMIRRIDPETPIIIESNGSAATATFGYMHPLPLKNIIYQAHMYTPGDYTHQGLGNMGRKIGNAYPGVIGKVMINKDYLRKDLQPIRDFQQKYGAKIFIGEFSVIIGAPGEMEYLRDVMDLMEEYGWDWTYHAFREWGAWSAEHTGGWRNGKLVIERALTDMPRKRLLMEYFKRNSQ